MSGCRPPLIDFVGGSLYFLDLDICFLPQVGKFSRIISSNKFSAPFSLFSFWDPYDKNVIVLDGVTEFPKCVPVLHNSVFFICSV